MILFPILFLSCVSIKIKKSIAIDYYNLGKHYFDMEKYQNAIKYYEKSLEYNINNLKSILNLIISYQSNKQYDIVEKKILLYYKKGDSEYKKKFLLLLGNNFYLQEKYNRAIKTYNEFLETYPDDEECYFNLGLTYLKLSDEKKALDNFLEAYKKSDFKHIPSIYNIADYYYKKENFENSFKYFKILVELDTNNHDAYYRLGELEYKMKEYEQALNHLKSAIKLDNKNKDYHILTAKIYSKGYKNKSKTLEYIEKALNNDFKDLKYLQSQPEFKLLSKFNEYKKLLKKHGLK